MKWFFGVLLLLLAALLLESSLLAYAMYVLLGLLLLSRWLARSWIGGLSAMRTCKQVTADIGDRIPVSLTVVNSGALPVPWVLAEDLLPQYSAGKRFPRFKIKGKRTQIAMLRGGAEMEMKYQIECLMRGYFQIGPLTLEAAISLGNLRRSGLAVTAVLILLDTEPLERAYGRLIAEGIRDIRHLKDEAELPELCRRQVDRSSPYTFVVS
jgi:uncharacterized protein (DUF58 family)